MTRTTEVGRDLIKSLAPLVERTARRRRQIAMGGQASAQCEAVTPEPPRVFPLRRGHTGQAVRDLQRALGVPSDGQFGPITEDMVRRLQAARALPDEPGVADRWTQAQLGCPYVIGVDVYNSTGPVDWHKAKASGVSFGFAKASQHRADARIRENVAGAAAAGVPLGAYFYADVTATPGVNVLRFLSALGGRYDLPLPPVLDQETGTADEVKAGLWTRERQRWLRGWTADALKALADRTGRRPLLYTSARRLNTYMDGGDGLSAFADLWIVRYDDDDPDPCEDGCPAGWDRWRVWQLGSDCRVRWAIDGIRPGRKYPNALDVDVCDGAWLRSVVGAAS